MQLKNYYLTLGISRYESAAGVHDAFRELAKQYHPDVAGPESVERFRNLLEAYKNLSAPHLRARYNHSLQEAEAKESPKVEPIVVDQRKGSKPEPLVSEPVSILRSFETVSSIF